MTGAIDDAVRVAAGVIPSADPSSNYLVVAERWRDVARRVLGGESMGPAAQALLAHGAAQFLMALAEARSPPFGTVPFFDFTLGGLFCDFRRVGAGAVVAAAPLGGSPVAALAEELGVPLYTVSHSRGTVWSRTGPDSRRAVACVVASGRDDARTIRMAASELSPLSSLHVYQGCASAGTREALAELAVDGRLPCVLHTAVGGGA